METRFSQRLSRLMKERKISGQKIADVVGKSQKTISRYATGEIEPSEEMKNAIFRAIADISGVEEDAITEQQLDEIEFFSELTEWIMNNPECGENRIAKDLMESNENNLRNVFLMLSIGAKQYYLEYFSVFHMVEAWENEVLQFFNNLPSNKKDELMRYLERFDFDYKSLTNIEKLAAYLKMINTAKNSPLLIIDKEIELDNLSEKEKALVDSFDDKLYKILTGNEQGTIPCYPWFLSYTSYDWYFLLRVHIFELYDTDDCLWAADWSGETEPEVPITIGRKLAFLLDSMK